MRIKKRQRATLVALAVFTIVTIFFFNILSVKNGTSIPTWSPIGTVTQREGLFSLTVNVGDDTEEAELMMFSRLMKESGIPVCFFLTEGFCVSHPKAAAHIAANHELGLLITDDTEFFSRGEMMRYLAKKNEAVFANAGRYPRYVRSTHDELGFLPHILDAYGQYGIASKKTASPTDGAIVDLGTFGSATASLAVSLTTEGARAKLSPTQLRELLYSVDIKPDEFGVQHGEKKGV